MATKKNNEIESEFKQDDRVSVLIPPAAENEENFVLVGVNGEMMKIQRGVVVKIPKAFKEVLDNSRIATKVLEATKAKASKRA